MSLARSLAIIISVLYIMGFVQGNPLASSSKSLIDHINDLLNYTEAENEYARFLSYINLFPPEHDIKMKALYHKYFSFDSYRADIIRIYAELYTSDDIDALVKFFSSPVGKKSIEVEQQVKKQIQDQMLNKISDYVQELLQHNLDNIINRF